MIFSPSPLSVLNTEIQANKRGLHWTRVKVLLSVYDGKTVRLGNWRCYLGPGQTGEEEWNWKHIADGEKVVGSQDSIPQTVWRELGLKIVIQMAVCIEQFGEIETRLRGNPTSRGNWGGAEWELSEMWPHECRFAYTSTWVTTHFVDPVSIFLAFYFLKGLTGIFYKMFIFKHPFVLTLHVS